MYDHRVALKVKIKSLAAEARIIRREERRAIERRDQATLTYVRNHRVGPVREEARHSLIAYAIVRGRPTGEHLTSKPFNSLRVLTLVRRYGTKAIADEFQKLLQDVELAKAA